MKKSSIAALIAPLAAIALAGPALAAGPVMPPTIPDTPDNQFFYNMWFGPTNPEWVPQGTIVADSGFRPTPNGLPYVNYGDSSSLDFYSLFFDMPTTPLTPMDSVWMQSLYGRRVCQGPAAPDGSCDMTPAARYLSEQLFESVNATGHCVGFAIVAAGVFNGQLDPELIGAKTLGVQSQLLPEVEQLIARNWSTQNTTRTTDLTPTGILDTLRQDLDAGDVPYALILHWIDEDGNSEGHAITPYAVYDRGNGLYDIAVYDNNYPFKERAVHVDTVADTWEYEVLLDPSAPPTLATGDATTKTLQLQSVADSLETQDCPVCVGGRDNNLIVFDPVPTEVARQAVYYVQSFDGGTLPEDDLHFLAPLDTTSSDLTSLPAVDVNPALGFRIALDGSDVESAFPLTINNLAANGVKIASIRQLPAGASAETWYNDEEGLFAFGADVPTKPRMDVTFTEGIRHYTTIVYGGADVAADNGRGIQVVNADDYVAYGDAEGAGGSMTVTISLERRGVGKKFRAQDVAYPGGGQLLLDYSDFTRTNQRPTFGIDDNSDGVIDTPVKMKRVGR